MPALCNRLRFRSSFSVQVFTIFRGLCLQYLLTVNNSDEEPQCDDDNGDGDGDNDDNDDVLE